MGLTSSFENITSATEILPWTIDINVFAKSVLDINFKNIALQGAATSIFGATKESGGSQNDEINWDVVLGSGTWGFELIHARDTNRGIYTVSLDVTGTLGTIDGYNATLGYNRSDLITGISVAANGKQRLKLKMATKNASSSAYYGSIQSVRLYRTA